MKQLEMELKRSHDDNKKLQKSVRDKENQVAQNEQRYASTLAKRAKTYSLANETLWKETDRERVHGKALKDENRYLRSEVDNLKISINDFKNELSQGRARLKQVEKSYDDTLKKRLTDVEDRIRKRFEKNHETVKLKNRDLLGEIDNWKKRVEEAQFAQKHFKNKLEEQNKEHQNKIVRDQRSTQHAFRSAVLKAEDRKRDSLQHHQEQSRALERELRRLKTAYEEKLTTERETAQKKTAKLSDDMVRARREASLLKNETSQVKKLWRQTQSDLKDSEAKLADFQEKIKQLDGERGTLPDAESLLRAERRKNSRLEELIQSGGGSVPFDEKELKELQGKLDSAETEIRDQQDEIERLTTMYQATEYSKALETEALRDSQTQIIKLETQYKIALGELKKKHREAHAKFEAERVSSQQKADKAQRQLQQVNEKLSEATLEKTEQRRSEMDTQRMLSVQRNRELQLEEDLVAANTEIGDLSERAKTLQVRFLVELGKVRKHYEDKLAGQASQALEALRNAVNIAEQRYERAENARQGAETELEKIQCSSGNPEEHTLLGADTKALPESDYVNQLLAEIDQVHGGGQVIPETPIVNEENQRLKGTIEELKERLIRAEEQLTNFGDRADDEREKLEETLAQQRQKNEDLAKAIEDWPKSRRKQERLEFHRDAVPATPSISKTRHQAEHLIYNHETLLMLCRKLEEEWQSEGFARTDLSDSQSFTVGSAVKSGTSSEVSALVSKQLEALEDRLKSLKDHSKDERSCDSLDELRSLLSKERLRLNRLHEGRKSLIEKVGQGTKDLTVLVKLAEMALADRRIHSELVRVTVAVDAIDFAIRSH
jgi:hypothetical protein